jgi:mono/diheme cytochrome c family protein
MKRGRFLAAASLLWCSAAALPAADGEGVYVENCASCHGRDGKGRTPAGRKMGAKDLALSQLPDAEVGRQIREGTKDAKGNARMPAFGDKLTPDEIAAVAAYVKALRK